MGLCCSAEASDVSPPASAARTTLILPDGELRQPAQPIRAADALHNFSACFVCDADEMQFDGLVSAMAGDAVLRPGKLYFVLPVAVLKRPLTAGEMAALAVKASAALTKASSSQAVGRRRWRSGRRAVSPVVFEEAEMGNGETVKRVEVKKKGKRDGNGRKFMPSLRVIPE